VLAKQPLWNNVGGWKANKDLPLYNKSRDLLKKEEEHKLQKEEVHCHYVPGLGYRRA